MQKNEIQKTCDTVGRLLETMYLAGDTLYQIDNKLLIEASDIDECTQVVKFCTKKLVLDNVGVKINFYNNVAKVLPEYSYKKNKHNYCRATIDNVCNIKRNNKFVYNVEQEREFVINFLTDNKNKLDEYINKIPLANANVKYPPEKDTNCGWQAEQERCDINIEAALNKEVNQDKIKDIIKKDIPEDVKIVYLQALLVRAETIIVANDYHTTRLHRYRYGHYDGDVKLIAHSNEYYKAIFNVVLALKCKIILGIVGQQK